MIWTQNYIYYMPFLFFISSSVDGYLGCFHMLVIVINATMNHIVLFHLPELLQGRARISPSLQMRSTKGDSIQLRRNIESRLWQQCLYTIMCVLYTHFTHRRGCSFCLANSGNWPSFFKISLPIVSSSRTFIDPMAMQGVLGFSDQQTSTRSQLVFV